MPLYITKIFNLPISRQFTQSQILILKDSMSSEYTNCNITIFSGRPPALLCVDNPQTYFTWFDRIKVKNPEKKLKQNVNESKWIDVFGFAVHLRKCYLEEFCAFVDKLQRENHANLYRFHEDTSCLFLRNDVTGLKTTDGNLVQIVTSNIVPTNPYKFLIHYVLSYGSFVTEIDLFNKTSMLDVFKDCNLLQRKDSYTKDDAYQLIKHYVLRELKYLPGASRSFDRHLIASYDLFTSLVTRNQVHFDALPLTLHEELTENAEISFILHNSEKKERSVQGCLLNPALSILEQYKDGFLNASRSNPFVFPFQFPRADGQSDISYNFQKKVFNYCLQKLKCYINRTDGFVRHQFFLGRPGSGKTLVCIMVYLHAVAKGLNCAITCLSGERAQQLGGEHVHKMFKFRVNKIPKPELLASQSINALLRDVTRFTELERLDVLFIDEVGQLNSEVLAAMEIVLQTVRDNKLPMGGVFTIMTGDPKQLKPPDGSLVWLSPSLLTNYDFHYFIHYVRASPGMLREILAKMDHTEITATDASDIAKQIVANCKIIATLEEENDTFAMRVFSTRAAEKEAVKMHSEKVSADQSRYSIVLTAVDEESSTGSSIWLAASDVNSRFIDSTSITPRKLILYKEALLRFTANITHIQARQGQLCVLLQVPNEMSTTVEVWIAPAGCRSVTDFNEALLTRTGWRKADVTKVYTPVMTNQNKFLRRFFFPLKNYVASTIHKCLGDTFPKIITKISLSENNYKIWEKEQLLVLMSRVSKLDDITLVGNKEDLILTIAAVLQKESCWSKFINELLEKLVSPSSPQDTHTLNLQTTDFVPWNVLLPRDSTGFVYLLISTKISNCFYIGECLDLRLELKSCNCGNGAEQTRPIERRPWAIIGFVTGFNTEHYTSNFNQRKILKSKLEYAASSLGVNVNKVAMFNLFQNCSREFANQKELNLKIVQCGS